MPDHETALKVYNQTILFCDELCILGDGSNGRRLKIYKIVAPKYKPVPYLDWEDYFKFANENGFVGDSRNCWHLIRISKHGTIEFRMFGATKDLDKIHEWAYVCRELCKKAM